MKRIISWILCLAFLVGVAPLAELKVFAEEMAHEAFTIDNGYVKVNVSKENGGFTINTAEGDQLKKSDNNKELLYHNGQYDTSFVSFKVTSGSDVNEYIFGGKYGNISDPSRNGVTVTQTEVNGEIIAEWSVGELTFAQSISLANPEANEHGMVSIQLAVQNRGSQPAKVEARVLYDTSLGGIDYGYYQVRDNQNITHTITTEQILDGASFNIPQNFYATNDPYDPTVIAYSVNAPQATPSKIAFGHWNNLASTLFDFGPDGTVDFTSYANDNLTQDSAYALYYDLGDVDAQNPKSMITYYGVYSNKDVSLLESVSVNISAPLKLQLNDEKTDFVHLVNHGSADFSAGVSFENFASDTAQDFTRLTMAIRTTGNLRILEESGAPIADYGFESGKYYTVHYSDVAVGDVKSSTLYFDARLSNEATYERISITLHDTSQTGGNISENNKVGEKTVYILLPGSDGNLPEVSFVSMTPDIIYYSGTRHLYVAITNEIMLTSAAVWTLTAYSLADRSNYYEIPHDNITVKEGIMDVAFTEDMQMSTGGWYLELKWSDEAVEQGMIPAEHQVQTAPELHFTVSEDKKYKNESYGVLAIVEYRENSDSSIYKIEKFADEDKFKKFETSGEFTEILMIFRGEFTTTHTIVSGGTTRGSYFTGVSTKTIDADTRTHKVDNPITINNAIDFEGGTISIYYEDYKNASFERSDIVVEFDGELYTSDARTTIWKGKAAFSKIEQGKRFSLIRYNKNGVRKNDYDGDTITLVWPAAQGIGQTLAGLLFQLAYGELGVMVNDDDSEIGRVLSFSGCLDLSFVSPGAGNGFHNDPWEGFSSMWNNYKENSSVTDYVYSAGYINRMKDIAQKRTGGFNAENQAAASQNYVNDDPQSIAASVVVQDILFGCGEGFVGLNFEVAIAIENYIDAMPSISGRLKINTINDWAFSFNGGMQLATFALEAQLSFKSHNDIPVPDKIYFYVGGFKPGINIDGFGVVWITGGGGGISNLYDTIFLTQAVPPLKLILSVGFSIIQVLDGKATAALGLTGVSVTGENLKILGIIEAVRRVHLGLEWYPGIKLEASISLNLFQGVISGGGYIVLIGKDYEDWFFEMFARASIGIPNFVPIVGGMSIGSVDLGINTEKIWGSAKVLFVNVGITYYWGDNAVDFGTGGTKAKPSFPELLGKEDIPVYYDAERNQTLYAKIGTNISDPVPVEVIDLTKGIDLMEAGIVSDPGYKLHRFNLGVYSENNNAAILQATYDATSLEDAKNKAKSFKITSVLTPDAKEYPISFYEGVSGTENTVNSNVTFNQDTGKASFSFTVTNSEDYNKDWYISSGEVETSVVLYNVEPVPELTSVSAQSADGNQIRVEWAGSKLEELDSISFFLVDKNSLTENFEPIINADGSMDGGYLVDSLDTSENISSKAATLTIPADLPSGNYCIRAVYSKMDEVNGSIVGTAVINHTNSLTPQQAVISDIKPAGNLEFAVEIGATEDINTTGYSVTVYNQDGTATDVAGLTFNKTSGGTTFNVGGSYEHEDVSYGLVGGNIYKIGITPYNLVDTNADYQPDTAVYGTEIMSGEITLPQMSTPKASFLADVVPSVIEYDHDGDLSNEKIKIDTYTKEDITFTVQLDEVATGSWKLNDGGINGSFTDSNTFNIPLTDLTDGSHTIIVSGRDIQGDTFMQSYRFDVDTVAPKLLVSSPVNGQLFNKNGTLSITGVTDYDAIFTVKVDDAIVIDQNTVSDIGGTIGTDGVFSFDIEIPDPNASSSRKITVIAEDKAKNSVVKEVTVAHGALADIQELGILVDGQEISSGNISVNPVADSPHKLSLIGKTKTTNGIISFVLPDTNVSWAVMPVSGSASVDPDGALTIEAGSQGMIVGRLQVSDKGSRTAAISFGAEVTGGLVSVSSSIGGSVTGGGQYNPGDVVTLVATPNSGYRFAGWVLTGVTVADNNATTITFPMPLSGNVTAVANFTATGSTGGAGVSLVNKVLKLNAGEYAEVNIPSSADENEYVPYYFGANKEKVYVPMSAVINGKLVFIAPVTAEYFFEENQKTFADTDGHWAKSNIDFTTARELFNGISETLFDPDGSMTRAMFVTVLHRLDGAPKPEGKSPFDDVYENTWYSDAVTWANANNIVKGISETMFAPDENVTREQMCALIARYLSYKGYALESGNGITFRDKDSISDWALADVESCVAAEIITGYPDNTFKPQSSATRAENCTVLRRVIQNILKKQ